MLAATTYVVVLPRDRFKKRGSRLTYLGLLALTVICLPFWLVLFLVSASGIAVSVHFLRAEYDARRLAAGNATTRANHDPVAFRRRSLALLALGLVPVMLLDPKVWLPAELIEAPNEPAVVGYVLSESDGELVVLKDRPRAVERLPSEGAERSYCSAQITEGRDNPAVRTLVERSALSFLFPFATYPACPVN